MHYKYVFYSQVRKIHGKELPILFKLRNYDITESRTLHTCKGLGTKLQPKLMHLLYIQTVVLTIPIQDTLAHLLIYSQMGKMFLLSLSLLAPVIYHDYVVFGLQCVSNCFTNKLA